MDTSAQNSNLFEVLQRGDKAISQVDEKAIILVGLTRSGKSTTYNWLNNKNLIGSRATGGLSYVSGDKDQDSAQMGKGFNSVTLAPNILKGFRQGVSLADMAGFQDSRDFIGVIGVSYFLKSIFSKVRKVKFLIVMTQTQVSDDTGKSMINVLTKFIEMFNFKEMNQTHIEELKRSLAIVITKAGSGVDYYEKLNDIIANLEYPSFNFQYKQLIVKLLKFIVENNMIENFNKAIINVCAPQCKLVQRLEEMNWNYFDLNKVQQQLKGNAKIIKVPYQKDYAALKEQQKNKFKQTIQKKTLFLKNFAKIIEIMMTCFKSSWSQCVKVWEEGKRVQNKFFDMNQVFTVIRSFLNQFDDYNTQKSLHIQDSYNQHEQKLMPAIEKIIQIQRIIFDIQSHKDETTTEFQGFKRLEVNIPEMFKLLNYFSSHQEEQKLIFRIQYAYLQSFSQLTKLCELDQEAIRGLSREIPDSLNVVFQEDKSLKQTVITDLKQDILAMAFSNLEEFEHYQQFFDKFYDSYNNECQPLFLSRAKYGICFTKGELLFLDNKKKAAEYYLETLIQIKQIIEYIPNSNLSQEQKQPELDKLYLKNCKMIRKVVNILKDLSGSSQFTPKIEAMKLCKHHRQVHLAVSIYDSIIKDPRLRDADIKQSLDDYISYTIEWGMLSKATELLYLKINLEEDNMEEQRSAANKLKEIFDYQNTNLLANAKTHVNNWKRVPIDEEYSNMLNEIKAKLSM